MMGHSDLNGRVGKALALSAMTKKEHEASELYQCCYHTAVAATTRLLEVLLILCTVHFRTSGQIRSLVVVACDTCIAIRKIEPYGCKTFKKQQLM